MIADPTTTGIRIGPMSQYTATDESYYTITNMERGIFHIERDMAMVMLDFWLWLISLSTKKRQRRKKQKQGNARNDKEKDYG